MSWMSDYISKKIMDGIMSHTLIQTMFLEESLNISAKQLTSGIFFLWYTDTDFREYLENSCNSNFC